MLETFHNHSVIWNFDYPGMIEDILNLYLDVIIYNYYCMESRGSFRDAKNAFNFVWLLKQLNDLKLKILKNEMA